MIDMLKGVRKENKSSNEDINGYDKIKISGSKHHFSFKIMLTYHKAVVISSDPLRYKCSWSHPSNELYILLSCHPFSFCL